MFKSTSFAFLLLTLSSTFAQSTTDNCGGVECRSPFSNSSPTCITGADGNFACSAACVKGYTWNQSTLLCVSSSGQHNSLKDCSDLQLDCTAGFSMDNGVPACINYSGSVYNCGFVCNPSTVYNGVTCAAPVVKQSIRRAMQ